MGRITILFADTLNTTTALKLRWAKADTPTAYIGSQTYAANASGHPQRSLTIEDLDDGMHNVELWRSTDGVTYETHQLTLQVDASLVTSEHIVYEYEVGRGLPADPQEGDFEVVDERLVDTSWYLEQRGIGKLKDVEYNTDPETGTWTLLLTTMVHGDTYWAIVERNVSSSATPAPTPTASGGEYYDVVTVSNNILFSGDIHGRKVLYVTTSSTVATIEIPLLSSVAKTKVLIQTHGMTGRYCYLKFQTADTVAFLGSTAVGAIYLGRGEEIELLFTGSACYVLRYEGGARRVGDILLSRTMSAINALVANGAEYNTADLPRLMQYVNSLPANQVLTRAQWEGATNVNGQTEYLGKGFFMVDGTKMRVPDLRDRYLKPLTMNDTLDRLQISGAPGWDDVAGALQWDAVYKHNHGLPISAETVGSAYYGRKTLTGNVQLEDFHFGLNYNQVHLTETVGENKGQVRNIGFVPIICI